MYYGILLPVGLVVLYFFFFKFDIIYLLIAFATPLSVNLLSASTGNNLSLPSELLLIGATAFVIFHAILSKEENVSKIANHNVSKVIYFYLGWIFITACTSQLPIVSFKSLASTLWFVIPLYFGGLFYFQKKNNIRYFLWAHTIALIIVVFYTLYVHGSHGFSKEVGHWAMSPFYNDHTAYGAILALFIPVVFAFLFDKKSSKLEKFFALVAGSILVVALYFSYSRAAWVSLIAAIGVFAIVIFRIKFRWVLVIFVSFAALFYVYQFQILDKMQKNKQDSSENFTEHVRSISNISSDASNLERINRWQAAISMFKEKPLFGFGPGTYQFEYAPYQRSMDKTIISTNFGNMGNAHSEYLGPLSEQGLLGLVNFTLLAIFSLITGFRVYKKSENQSDRIIALGISLGLITYFVHGFLNNFLDTDKLSVPFWSLISILVALDIKRKSEIRN